MTGTSFRYAGQRQPLLDVTSKQRPEMMRSQPPEALGLKKKKKKRYSGQRNTKYHGLKEKLSSNVQWVNRARNNRLEPDVEVN